MERCSLKLVLNNLSGGTNSNDVIVAVVDKLESSGRNFRRRSTSMGNVSLESDDFYSISLMSQESGVSIDIRGGDLDEVVDYGRIVRDLYNSYA